MSFKIYMPNAKLDRNGRLVEKRQRVKGYESCEYNGGRYDSRAEARYAAELDLRVRTGEIREWRRQVTVELAVNGCRICQMRVDFVVVFKDKHEEWHEVKGFASREWEIKRNLFRALFPERPYVVIAAGGIKPTVKRAWPKRRLAQR